MSTIIVSTLIKQAITAAFLRMLYGPCSGPRYLRPTAGLKSGTLTMENLWRICIGTLKCMVISGHSFANKNLLISSFQPIDVHSWTKACRRSSPRRSVLCHSHPKDSYDLHKNVGPHGRFKNCNCNFSSKQTQFLFFLISVINTFCLLFNGISKKKLYLNKKILATLGFPDSKQTSPPIKVCEIIVC